MLDLILVVSRSPSLIAYCCAAMLAKSCSFLVVGLCPSQLPQLVLSWPTGFFACLFLMSALSFSFLIALLGRLAIARPAPFNSVEGPSVPCVFQNRSKRGSVHPTCCRKRIQLIIISSEGVSIGLIGGCLASSCWLANTISVPI